MGGEGGGVIGFAHFIARIFIKGIGGGVEIRGER